MTIFSVVLLILIVFIIATYNKLVKLKNRVKEAFSTMDVYLKKRFDLIPNLVETTKGYALHEKSTLEELTALRNKNYSTLFDDKKIELNQQISARLSKLIAVVENYPDLKANQNFINLQNELSKIEEDIASSRGYYNRAVREYNTCLELFPTNIFASLFNFKSEKMFEIESKEKETPRITF